MFQHQLIDLLVILLPQAFNIFMVMNGMVGRCSYIGMMSVLISILKGLVNEIIFIYFHLSI
jgi:hypothetical protein